MLRGKQLEESIVRQSGSDFNLNEVLRELEEEIQLAAASLEDERAALLRDQILELKNGTGVTKIEPKKRLSNTPGTRPCKITEEARRHGQMRLNCV